MSWEDPDEPPASLVLRTSSGELSRMTLDGVVITAWPDRRRFAASALQPTRGSGSARERADAWVEAIVAADLGVAHDVEVVWAGDGLAIDVTSATRVRGAAGTQPITVVRGVHPLDRDEVVVVGVGDPVEVLERQPEPRTLRHGARGRVHRRRLRAGAEWRGVRRPRPATVGRPPPQRHGAAPGSSRRARPSGGWSRPPRDAAPRACVAGEPWL